jgi:signal transduction histidine kinase
MKFAIAAASIALLTQSAMAADYATPREAEALVAKVVTAIKSDAQKTYDEINAKKWSDRDLYPVVYDLNGKVLAHGQTQKMVGKDLIELRDADGKMFVKERMELAKSKGKFWQDYKFIDPVTKQILPKQMYCERLAENVVCAGIYKR